MPLNQTERAEIERRGGRVTTVKYFLGLSDDEEVEVERAADAYIDAHRQIEELKTKLIASIKRRRKLVRMGHVLPPDRIKIAKHRKLGSGSARIASLDLMVSAFIAVGGTRDELADLIARK